jgi:hypothetical protein
MRLSPCLLVTLLALAFVPARAAAAASPPGVNLRWDQCYGDGGTWNKTFACNTNLGSERLVGSFELDQPLTQVSGLEIVVDLSAQAPSLPAWWMLKNAGSCRPASLSAVDAPPSASANCVDWAQGLAVGGVAAYTLGVNGPLTARIICGFAVAAQDLANLDPGLEYYAFTVIINHAKTVGTGACGACDVPACIFLSQIHLDTPPVTGEPNRDVYLDRGANYSGSQWVTWQNGYPINIERYCAFPVPEPICKAHDTTFDCVLATPTRTYGSTWGQVKSLYR